MSRSDRTIGTLLPTVVAGAGASAGPAFGDTSAPTESTTTEPATTEVAAPTTTETGPSAAEPAVPEEPAEVAESAGRFAFQDLPRGRYSLSFAASDWSFPWTYLEVDGEDDRGGRGLARARRPADGAGLVFLTRRKVT